MVIKTDDILGYEPERRESIEYTSIDYYANILAIQSRLLYVAAEYAENVLSANDIPHTKVVFNERLSGEYVDSSMFDIFEGDLVLTIPFSADEIKITMVICVRPNNYIELTPSIQKRVDNKSLEFDLGSKTWGPVVDR